MKSVIVTAVLLLACGSALAQGAPEKAAICVACHGQGGAKPILPDYPILAGQHADYLEQALREYKAGTRKNPVMAAQVANLGESDLRALSKYFSEQPSPLYTPGMPATAAK